MNLRITLLLLTIVTPLAAAPKPVTLVVDDVPVVSGPAGAGGAGES
ncbi:outer membrane porin HofQ [Enterobacter cloacae]|uniref:Outer membrane porin HofQ n=1 Tax=Enterobacter cloacae TaxID=550 RepID=A0A377LRK8_ENTCL|nr:outer membrane porin HofQ [Enterobacter cloacae]